MPSTGIRDIVAVRSCTGRPRLFCWVFAYPGALAPGWHQVAPLGLGRLLLIESGSWEGGRAYLQKRASPGLDDTP